MIGSAFPNVALPIQSELASQQVLRDQRCARAQRRTQQLLNSAEESQNAKAMNAMPLSWHNASRFQADMALREFLWSTLVS